MQRNAHRETASPGESSCLWRPGQFRMCNLSGLPRQVHGLSRPGEQAAGARGHPAHGREIDRNANAELIRSAHNLQQFWVV